MLTHALSRLPLWTFVVFAALGCAKSEPPTEHAPPTAYPSPTFTITGTPQASSLPALTEPASATGSVQTPTQAAVPSSRGSSAQTSSPVATAVASAAPHRPTPEGGAGRDGAQLSSAVVSHVEGKHFALDTSSVGCHGDEECTMAIRLGARDEFHLNKEFPYKFVATTMPGVAYLGVPEPNVFSRAAGDFREQDEKTATMTVRFRLAKTREPGPVSLAGNYKFSVCSAERCQVEQQAITLRVPVQ